MKIGKTVLFILMANFAFGQIICNKNDYTDAIYSKVQPIRAPIGDGYEDDNTDWSREDFIKNKINTISVYSYCFDIKLNNIEDSFLLYRKQFDIQENKILKTIYERGFLSHIIERNYNAMGQIIKEREKYDNSKYDYYHNIYETDYEYDSLHREIKKTEKEITQHYSKRDTTEVIDAKIDEYVYNSNNQKTEWYYTVDKRKTTKYFITKRKPNTKYKCIYCIPKYLYTKCEYDTLAKLTNEISFTQDNEIYTKRNYFYDDQNRLIKQIDSTWQLTVPYGQRIITYEYIDTGKIVTEIYNRKKDIMDFKTISYYNKEDKIVKICTNWYWDSESYSTEYFYFYENDKLTKKIANYWFVNTYITTYYYNERGLLKEEQDFKNDKITKLVRYYYE